MFSLFSLFGFYFCLSCIPVFTFLMIRVIWVFKRRTEYSHKVGPFLNIKVLNNDYLFNDEKFQKDLEHYFSEVQYNYNKMVFLFWIWNPEKLCNYPESYKEVMNKNYDLYVEEIEVLQAVKDFLNSVKIEFYGKE